MIAIIALVASLVALAVSTGSPHRLSPLELTAVGIGYTPKLVPKACPAGSSGPGVTCGHLIVPQDRTHPKGRQIQLLVVRAAAQTAHPAPDPVVELGDPTSDYSGEGPSSTTRLHSNYIELSPRGGTGSDPELTCSELDAARNAALALPPRSPQALTGQATAIAACRARLVGSGIDPNAYGNDAAAVDFRDLIRVMHIQRANLLTTYNGSMLAFDVMRQYPQLVRSVAIEDPVPPGLFADAFVVSNLAGAVDRYAALCSADQRCRTAFPDIRGQEARDFAQFRQTPVTIKVTLPPDKSPVPVLVDGDSAVMALVGALSSPIGLPVAAAQISAPDPATIASVVPNELGGFVPNAVAPWGAAVSYTCKDGIPGNSRNDRQQEQAAALVSPQFAGVDVQYQFDLLACRAWNVKPDSSSDFGPIVSDIPVFLFGGALDPTSSPAWYDQITQGLTHAVVVRFPTLTYYSVESSAAPACLATLRLDFLRHPANHLKVSGCEAQSPPVEFEGT